MAAYSCYYDTIFGFCLDIKFLPSLHKWIRSGGELEEEERGLHRLHREFWRLLFLQAHRETDRFFAASEVQLAQSTSGHFHYRRAAFSSQLKSKIGNIFAKASVLRIN